ncbi:4-hydroxy-tetrahydrodipicolinate synthase [Flavobacteriaceae bacterium TP-CH-4]|uniref:4-hydroxy-tetrahydrodipicolinate synthase n=1 Tax=Pelagihabitans pacificus TaxID=2696054 RepID=A0A967AXB0_9FLAO|nr:4-hydroxy-tetrahydrodipicolinate synthase [Pelagihabitans pacificus]NHF59307.1 4-hydroxy-tetrahydrodipicolinate synthase [Pelagihabitans pacificus]
MKELVGTGVALVTPFTDDLQVDVDALGRIVEHCIAGGVGYLVVLGTTGESVTLDKSEKQLVADTVVAANAGRLPLVLGVGGNNTAAVIEELQTIDLSAFHAILSVSPYYNKPTQEGIYQHFKAIAASTETPIILYNVPGRTGSNMVPETVLRLANDCPTVVAIKEASGDLEQIRTLIKKKPKKFQILSGDDMTALPTVLAGGAGVISVLGQGLPTAFSKMIRMGLQGKEDQARALHLSMAEGMDLIFKEGNPAGIKGILEILGLCSAKVRLPLVEATPGLKAILSQFVDQMVSHA